MSESVLRDERFREFWRRLREAGAVPEPGSGDEFLDVLADAVAKFRERTALPSTATMSLEAVDVAKAEGNDCFRAGRYLDASLAYGRALAVCPADGPRSVLLANRAAALVECDRPVDAEKDARLAVRIRPDYAKGWARLGAALAAQRRDADAEAALQRALSLDGDLAKARSLLELVRARSPSTARG